MPEPPVDVRARIHSDFASVDEQRQVIALLGTLWDRPLNVGPAQLCRSILVLAEGNVQEVRKLCTGFLGDPRDVIMAAERKADIATANDEELAMFKARNPELADQLRIIWTSPVIPQSPLVWSTALPLDLRRRIQQAIIAFGKKNAADREILRKVNNLSAFRKSRNSQLITAGDIDMFVAWQQVNNSTGLSEADKTARIRAISERASRLELRLKLPPSVQ